MPWSQTLQTRVPGFKRLPLLFNMVGCVQKHSPRHLVLRWWLRAMCRDAVSDTVMKWSSMPAPWCLRTHSSPLTEAYKALPTTSGERFSRAWVPTSPFLFRKWSFLCFWTELGLDPLAHLLAWMALDKRTLAEDWFERIGTSSNNNNIWSIHLI